MAAGVAGFDKERMRKARARAGLTYRQLAETVGVSYTVLVAYEKGHAKPRPAHLVSLAAALSCTVTYLAPMPRAPTLADYRERRGLTLTEMGELVGRHYGTVSDVEHAGWWPSSAELWAENYGLDPEEFLRAWRRGVSRP